MEVFKGGGEPPDGDGGQKEEPDGEVICSDTDFKILKFSDGKIRITRSGHDVVVDLAFEGNERVATTFNAFNKEDRFIASQEIVSHAGKKVEIEISTHGRRKHTFPFFELPAELRNMVYGWVLENESYEFCGYKMRLCLFRARGLGHSGTVSNIAPPTGAAGFFLPHDGRFRCLDVNRQIRSEFAPLAIERTTFVLAKGCSNSLYNDLELACAFINGIGEIGRANITAIDLGWWTSEWHVNKHFSPRSTAWFKSGFSKALTKLLKSCPRLRWLDVTIPYRCGLGSGTLKPNDYSWACGLENLRSLCGFVPHVNIISKDNEPLKNWLMAPVATKRSAEADDASESRKKRKG
ncbi:hypothetical protein BU16DRAFT_612740 [Lophium mytilinum]|uniref:Uncharacterized protein n=1 Tax=Lophium mytilinum TaxID=390894 RepID=A0A6A6RET2_9PEZI|nr:hypothetical protein BU16DRAFT_612740 [Lophium mytilinum]